MAVHADLRMALATAIASLDGPEGTVHLAMSADHEVLGPFARMAYKCHLRRLPHHVICCHDTVSLDGRLVCLAVGCPFTTDDPECSVSPN